LVLRVFDDVAIRIFWVGRTAESTRGVRIGVEGEFAKALRVVWYKTECIGRNCWVMRPWK
jgi:hypothetical protein